MILKRKFVVAEVRATVLVNAPFILTLHPTWGVSQETSCATLGKSNRLFIGEITPGLLGKEIEITFREELNLPERAPELLIVKSLTRTESVAFRKVFGESRETVERLLVLETEVTTGAHPTPTPCPYYKFRMELREEEYKAIKQLPSGTVFSAWGVLS